MRWQPTKRCLMMLLAISISARPRDGAVTRSMTTTARRTRTRLEFKAATMDRAARPMSSPAVVVMDSVTAPSRGRAEAHAARSTTRSMAGSVHGGTIV